MSAATAPARGASLGYYRDLYDSIDILPEKRGQVVREAKRVISGRKFYMEAQKKTGVPWVFPGCIHEMECDSNFQRQILNGEKWNRVTVIEPTGRGPWPNWIAAAEYALKNKRREDKTWVPLDEITDWTIPNLLLQWERWNGGGYRRRGKHSPYLFAGSQHAEGSGYFTSDHGYDAAAKSQQIGAAVLLREIIALGQYGNPMDGLA